LYDNVKGLPDLFTSQSLLDSINQTSMVAKGTHEAVTVQLDFIFNTCYYLTSTFYSFILTLLSKALFTQELYLKLEHLHEAKLLADKLFTL
jgi:tetrahydromethanopterin S-methyltransferase subunit B